MRTSHLIGIAVAAGAGLLVAALLLFGASPSPGGAPASAPDAPRIFGDTAPAPAAAPTHRPTTADARRVAQAWAAAWTRLTACPADAAGELDTVLALSTGALRDTLEASPPRPTAAELTRCRPPRLRRVEVHAVPEGWFVIASRKGDGVRPLKLRLHVVDGEEVRVATIDF